MAKKARPAADKKPKKTGKILLTTIGELENKLRLAGEELTEVRGGVELFRREADAKHRQNESLHEQVAELHKELGKLRTHLGGAQQAANKLGAELKQEKRVRMQIAERVRELEELLGKLRKTVDYHDYPLRRSTGFHTIRKMVGRG